MKKKLGYILLVAVISALSITACSKKADAPRGGNITKETLVGKYKITVLSEESPIETVDYLEDWSPCEKDNFFVLKGDMTSAVVDAGTVCDPSSDDTGTWDYPGNNTIVLNGSTFHIDGMDGTTLKMSATYNDEGVQKTLRLVYVKQ